MSMPQETHPNALQLADNAPMGRQKRLADRELAKLGLAVAVGVLVVTGLSRSRSSRQLHVIAGGALVGLSVWHHLLYPSRPSHIRGNVNGDNVS